MNPAERTLNDRIGAGLLWAAAFSFACGAYLALTMALRPLPPTRPVAVGLATILGVSKVHDYVALTLFLAAVPALAIAFHAAGIRLLDRLQQQVEARHQMALTVAMAAPFLLSPFLYLTTGKLGWVTLLPPALAFGATAIVRLWSSSGWLQPMFRRELWPYHALLFAGGSAVLLFRYLSAGRRIAHVPTLFLELPFVALFAAGFWGLVLVAARAAATRFGADAETVFRKIATASAVLVLLPIVAICVVPSRGAPLTASLAVVLAVLLALLLRRPLAPSSAWRLASYVLLPILVYAVSYASTAHLSDWIDLFHRGETLGPASDYLRGKVPYRDVFALHGMLEDGLLDAWLMKLFGRSVAVTLARSAALGGLLFLFLWIAGIVVFESIPIALAVVAMGAWTTAENDRTFFGVGAFALLWLALRRRSRLSALASGVIAGIAVFFSYEIGLYAIAGAIASLAVLAFVGKRIEWTGFSPLRAAAWFTGGVALGAAPFVVYLATAGALGAFLETSFVVIPRIIDAVWSLPFPDLVSSFRGSNLNLHTLADFVLYEKLHLVLTPLAIAVATTCFVQRVVRRKAGHLDVALMMLTVFAAFTQRTAFGRAEFRHQYFAAALLGPLLVVLAVIAARSLRSVWASGGEGARAFVVALALAGVSVTAILLWVPDLVNARLDDLVGYQKRVRHLRYDARTDEGNDRIRAVSAYIRELTPGGTPIYDFSNQPAFYFFADRPNPTRFYQVPIASPAALQAEVIAALERAKPKVVLRTSPEWYDEFDGIPNASRAQAIAAYLDDCYSFDRAVRGVEIWRRSAGARPLAVAAYLRKIRMPDASAIVNPPRERMVFPVVGSVNGAGGAFWVSTLTLYNPRKQPLPLSLRYASAEGNVDRRLTLAPGETRRWGDVARTLFQAGDRIGALWIEYRGSQPVARLETVDAAHGGAKMNEKPLSTPDAAVSATEAPALTILGFPSRATLPGRRITIGLVNVGNAPAHYRVSARAADGSPVGRAFEVSVPEDQVELIADPEERMWVALGEATSVRVTVLRGAAVGFAMVSTEGSGGEFLPAVPSQQP